MSSFGVTERSVATEESRRFGNVTSEIADDREVCLGCPLMALTKTPSSVAFRAVVRLEPLPVSNNSG
jgi:hypothetical protein